MCGDSTVNTGAGIGISITRRGRRANSTDAKRQGQTSRHTGQLHGEKVFENKTKRAVADAQQSLVPRSAPPSHTHQPQPNLSDSGLRVFVKDIGGVANRLMYEALTRDHVAPDPDVDAEADLRRLRVRHARPLFAVEEH